MSPLPSKSNREEFGGVKPPVFGTPVPEVQPSQDGLTPPQVRSGGLTRRPRLNPPQPINTEVAPVEEVSVEPVETFTEEQFFEEIENTQEDKSVFQPEPVFAVQSTPSPAPVVVEQPEEDEEQSTSEEEQRRIALEKLSPEAKASATLLFERIIDDKCSEVLMNGPNNIIVKEHGNRLHIKDISFQNIDEYHTVINELILYDTDTSDRIGSAEHLIEGQLMLPDYDEANGGVGTMARVHVVAPPVVQAAKVTIAKKPKRSYRLQDLVGKETMSPVMGQFLKALARGKATIVISGETGAGKTTLLEALTHEFDENDRIVVIEDIQELRVPLYDVVPLLATSAKPGMDKNEAISLEWLVAQANRMRGDRIIVGESRGGEFAGFLAAANSGADGSMTTLHASSARLALDRMRSLAMKADNSPSETVVARDIASSVQIIVQMTRIDGKYRITQIDEVSNIVTAQGQIALQPIFLFDRLKGVFKAVGKPSDQLKEYLASRSVAIDNNWFMR